MLGTVHTFPRRDAPLGRDEAVWMIQVMGWIPADFPNSGATALMLSRFSEAEAAFSLQQAVRNVSALRGTEAPPPGTTEAGIEEVEVRSHSSTEVIESDVEVQETATVELPGTTSGCAFFDNSPADPPSTDRCGEVPPRGPPSTDPEWESENKRRRPRSCLRLLSSPVPRQATALPTDRKERFSFAHPQ